MTKFKSEKPTTPILFAHRGARADAPENTLAAFALAGEMGATGMESDVWVTSDGVPVLDHDGVVRSGLRKFGIGDLLFADLPDHIPSLAQYYSEIGPTFELSLDLKDKAALEPTLRVAKEAGAEQKLWLCHPDVDYLISIRESTEAKLVDSTRLSKLKKGPEVRAARLREHGIDAINMRLPDWNKGLVVTFHRFGLFAFGWDAQKERSLAKLFSFGIDGVYSDHVDRMFATLQAIQALES